MSRVSTENNNPSSAEHAERQEIIWRLSAHTGNRADLVDALALALIAIVRRRKQQRLGADETQSRATELGG